MEFIIIGYHDFLLKRMSTPNNTKVDKLLTNFNKKERYKYEKAIEIYNKLFGSDYLHVEELAYSKDGRILKDCNALYIYSDKFIDLSDFWKIQESL